MGAGRRGDSLWLKEGVTALHQLSQSFWEKLLCMVGAAVAGKSRKGNTSAPANQTRAERAGAGQDDITSPQGKG